MSPRLKKFLPLILLVVGIGVVTAAFFIFRGKGGDIDDEDTSALIEVALADRPFTSLTPSEDGHWLKLVIENLKIDVAESMDYELLYKLPDGRTQGVPGTVKLKGVKNIDRDLLLGSESSGKFRYDEGVEEGTLTLRFRNSKGKLLAKFSTDFTLASGTAKLASSDGKLKSTLSSSSSEYFVVMETFGLPDTFDGEIKEGPYGVFTSASKALKGTVSLGSDTFLWTGSKWTDSFTEATGVFVGI